MRSFVGLLAVSALAACGSECVIPPCVPPFAVQVAVHQSTSTTGIPGAFVRVTGSSDIPCTGGAASPCLIPGSAGTYQVDIGAPGFQTTHRSVDVAGDAAGCNSCGSVQMQHLDIALVPLTGT